MIDQLQAHTDALRRHLEWFASIGDVESSDVIRSNCISCLAYLANLYLTIAPTDHPTAPVMESRCDIALSSIGSLTEGTVMEDCSYFDSLLGVSNSLRVHTSLSPHRRRSPGRERWKDSKLERLSFRWNRPPRWYTGGRWLPMRTHCTRIDFLIANLLYSPPCPYLRTAERRIRNTPTSYHLKREQI